MTREEQISFCRRCTNRKFDTNRGIICGLTNDLADFEGSCKDFNEDESVKEKNTQPEVIVPNHEVVSQLSDSTKEKFKEYQDFGSAIIGGLLVTLLGAFIWALVTVATGYQIGYMAIGVGLLVGFGIRFFGAGIDQKFGILGGILALVSCLLGNLFSQVAFAAQAEGIGYLQTLQLLDWALVPQLYMETFGIMDLLFYGIAIAEGYKFAFRAISSQELELIKNPNYEPIPIGYKLRKPSGIIVILLFTLLLFKFNQGMNGEVEFTYEDGSRLSKGEYIDGKENGPWEYWYESGKTQAKVNFKNGVQDGDWIMYYESGQTMSQGQYSNGLLEGLWVNYYGEGVISDSGRYVNGREHDSWAYYHVNGNLMQTGSYENGSQEGLWKVYFQNGKIQSEGNMKHSSPEGLWTFWRENGQKESEKNFQGEETEIINAWDANNKQIVINGSGIYAETYPSGEIQSQGPVSNNKKQGKWITFFIDGEKSEEGSFNQGEYSIENVWDIRGPKIVSDGNGEYKRYSEDKTLVLEEGSVVNGKREGIWDYYYESGYLMASITYSKGKMEGNRSLYAETGVMLNAGNMASNKQSGEWVWYYQDGSVESRVNFVNGEKEGKQIFYDFTGNVIKEELYENGRLMSTQILSAQ